MLFPKLRDVTLALLALVDLEVDYRTESAAPSRRRRSRHVSSVAAGSVVGLVGEVRLRQDHARRAPSSACMPRNARVIAGEMLVFDGRDLAALTEAERRDVLLARDRIRAADAR